MASGLAPCLGCQERDRDILPATSDEDCLREMRAGRAALRQATGQDFWYDLAAWRDFLLSAPDDEFGYRHPHAFSQVDQAVQRAIRYQRRRRLVALLEVPAQGRGMRMTSFLVRANPCS